MNDKIREATGILSVLYILGYAVLCVSGFKEQAQVSIQYAVLLCAMTLVSGIIVHRQKHKVQAEKISTEWLTNNVLKLTIVYTVFCAVVATKLDGIQNNTSGLPTLLQTTIYWGVIRYTIGSVIPIFALKKLGASNKFLGLTRPNALGIPIGCLWIGCALTFIVVDQITKNNDIANSSSEILRNLFRAGISEEFLFRGAILGILSRRMPFGYANLIQALGFGLWHYGIDSTFTTNSNQLLTVPALMICVHTVFGYTLGLVKHWTQSLSIPIIFHSIADATSII